MGSFSQDSRLDLAVVGLNGSEIFLNDGLGNLGPGDVGLPVIQLSGSVSISLTVEDPYTDAGAVATDAIDGDITADIVVDNPVDPAVLGSYTITYNVTDRSGNAAVPVTRTVVVSARVGTGGGGGGSSDFVFLATLLLLGSISILRRKTSSWRH